MIGFSPTLTRTDSLKNFSSPLFWCCLPSPSSICHDAICCPIEYPTPSSYYFKHPSGVRSTLWSKSFSPSPPLLPVPLRPSFSPLTRLVLASSQLVFFIFLVEYHTYPRHEKVCLLHFFPPFSHSYPVVCLLLNAPFTTPPFHVERFCPTNSVPLLSTYPFVSFLTGPLFASL